jgi:rRNA-processing protein FCF1
LEYVVFDSSFLIAVVEKPATWYEDIQEKLGEFKPVMLDRVAGELDDLANRGGKRGRFAVLAKELGESFMKVRGEKGGSPDDEILSWAASNDAFVATLDTRMLEHLRASRMRYVTLRRGRVFIY